MQVEAVPIADRIMEANVRLSDLEAQQGAAMLDGKPFDPAPMAALRGELEALAAAEAEAARRERVALAESQRQQRAAIRKEAEETLAEYGKAVKRAEKTAKAMVAALADAQAHAQRLHRQSVDLGLSPHFCLAGYSVTDTLSRLIAGELTDLQGRCYFGVMKWNSVGHPNWSHHLDNAVIPAIRAIIKEENA